MDLKFCFMSYIHFCIGLFCIGCPAQLREKPAPTPTFTEIIGHLLFLDTSILLVIFFQTCSPLQRGNMPQAGHRCPLRRGNCPELLGKTKHIDPNLRARLLLVIKTLLVGSLAGRTLEKPPLEAEDLKQEKCRGPATGLGRVKEERGSEESKGKGLGKRKVGQKVQRGKDKERKPALRLKQVQGEDKERKTSWRRKRKGEDKKLGRFYTNATWWCWCSTSNLLKQPDKDCSLLKNIFVLCKNVYKCLLHLQQINNGVFHKIAVIHEIKIGKWNVGEKVVQRWCHRRCHQENL